MSHRKKKKNGIPDRWTDYQALGRRIPGTRFVAFKVPLKRSLRSLLPPTEAFGPLDLVQQLEEQQEELGLVIDLTYTTRYYTPEDLPNSVLYLKIFTAGHRVPSDPTILSFKRAVKSFLRENESNDKLIGVHCTHGLNRTGYLVCRYLIDVDGMDPAEAVEMFNCSRGHCIERENYLHDLQHGPKRSNKGMDKPEHKPIRGKADPQAWLPPHSEQETFDDSPCHSHYMYTPVLTMLHLNCRDLCTSGEGRTRSTAIPMIHQFLHPHSGCSHPGSSAAVNTGGYPMEPDLHLVPSSVPFPFISMFGQGLRIRFQRDIHTVHQRAIVTDPGGTIENCSTDTRTGLDVGMGLYPCIRWPDIEWSQWTRLQRIPSVNCFICWGGMRSHNGRWGRGLNFSVLLHSLLTMALGPF